MAHYFSFLAALFFSIAHILIRRGLVHSNAMTGSFVSLTISAGVLLLLVPFFVPYTSLWNPAIGYFIAAGIFAPGIGRTLGYVGIERIGVARSVPIVNSSPIFASIFAVFYLGELWVFQNIAGTCLVILGVIMLSMAKPADKPWRKMDVMLSDPRRDCLCGVGKLAQGWVGRGEHSDPCGGDDGLDRGAVFLGSFEVSGRKGGFQAAAPECWMADHRRHLSIRRRCCRCFMP